MMKLSASDKIGSRWLSNLSHACTGRGCEARSGDMLLKKFLKSGISSYFRENINTQTFFACLLEAYGIAWCDKISCTIH